MPYKTIQQNFANGELNPKMLGRSDVEMYYKSARKMRDVVTTPYGGFARRPAMAAQAVLGETTARITGWSYSSGLLGGEPALAGDNDAGTYFVSDNAITTVNKLLAASQAQGQAQRALRKISVKNAALVTRQAQAHIVLTGGLYSVQIDDGGLGHTSVIYTNPETGREKIDKFAATMHTCRILVNTPSSQGGIGDLYNFKLAPSLTLGCGSWGGNSVSENVGVKHLINIKTVAERRENMLWFRAPEKVYFKKGCLGVALKELKYVMNKKRAFVVTDSFLFKSGFTKLITDRLDEMGIAHTTFFEVAPDPTLACAKEGAKAMAAFQPDVILAMRFMDIRKRVYTFPHMGDKAYFIAIPTTAGTGSEVTPFAVITDEKTGTKYPLADYELLPDMAIIDADLMMSIPKGLTAASGIDALTHALEATASMMATDFTNGIAAEAIKLIFEYLPRAYKLGAHDAEARERMANASCMAGMAFANAFLGVCHSMAHKLGSYHHLPHGIANALMIDEVIRFNSAENPVKMGTFPQYKYPECLKRYANIADMLKLGGKTDAEKVENLIKAIDQLKAEVEIKPTIKDYGVDEKDFLDRLDQMSEDAFDDQCTGANPRYPLISEIKDMYLRAYYGK